MCGMLESRKLSGDRDTNAYYSIEIQSRVEVPGKEAFYVYELMLPQLTRFLINSATGDVPCRRPHILHITHKTYASRTNTGSSAFATAMMSLEANHLCYVCDLVTIFAIPIEK